MRAYRRARRAIGTSIVQIGLRVALGKRAKYPEVVINVSGSDRTEDVTA